MHTPLNAPDWLIARPIAHRGLHDVKTGIIENSCAAARAAIAKDYAIECDVQLSRDGEAIVFHDETLMRLTGIDGEIATRDAAEITALTYRGTDEPVATLATLLDTIAGRVPLVVELKSRFDGDPRLPARAAALAETYAGPLAFMSFDPLMMRALRDRGIGRPLGLVAQAHYREADWPRLSAGQREALRRITEFSNVKPDFLAWRVQDLPHLIPLTRRAQGVRVLAWTVRDAEQHARAQRWADQAIFEGFAP